MNFGSLPGRHRRYRPDHQTLVRGRRQQTLKRMLRALYWAERKTAI
jgi:hypothetical protein